MGGRVVVGGGEVVGGVPGGRDVLVRGVVTGMVVGVDVVVVGECLDPLLVTSRMTTMAAIATTRPMTTAIHLFRPLFCGR